MTYSAKNIKILKGLEAVRKRPGMYIGDTEERGLHHLIWEILDNSIDEAMAGHCDKISITLNKDENSITVEDNGRGIPVDIHPEEKIPAVEVVLTKLHAGGKFDEKSYAASGGLHGVGVSVVNALSSKLTVTIKRGKKTFEQTYSKGLPTSKLKKVGKATGTGTSIRFVPDPEIFKKLVFHFKEIQSHIESQTYLNPGVTFFVSDGGEPVTYLSKNGLLDFIDKILPKKDQLAKPIYVSGESGKIKVEAVLTWMSKAGEKNLSFCNNIQTTEGGTHATGFKGGLSYSLKIILPEALQKARKVTVVPDDSKEGLVSILSVKVPQPQFEGQTKTKLGSSEARGAVQTILTEQLKAYFEVLKNASQVKIIQEKILDNARVREATQRARENARKQSTIVGFTLPGKLADCQEKDPAYNEIFIVEGESAGGSAKQARSRLNQAILPLRGKVLNCERATMTQMLGNNEIETIISSLGVKIGAEFKNLDSLRYRKVIIMCDADSDGRHICTLLLTFFFRQIPELILKGYLYIAQPPLYRIKLGKKEIFKYTEEEKNALIEKIPNGKAVISRFKGLGEMPPDLLWRTTMNPEKRKMIQVKINDAALADQTFDDLMGNDPVKRFDFITENAKKVANLDV